jgi:hypothetical protein
MDATPKVCGFACTLINPVLLKIVHNASPKGKAAADFDK